MPKKVFRIFSDNFVTGIVVIMPIVLTFFIITFFFSKLNSILLSPLLESASPFLRAEAQRVFFAKTIIFIGVVIVIALIGFTTRIIVVKRTFKFFETILYRLPMVNKIYGSIKEISNAFLGKKKNLFKRVVLIQYPRKGIYSLAFITAEPDDFEPSEKVRKKLLNAYVPTTPNPTSGIFLLLPEKETTPLDMSVEEGIKMVISSGLVYKKLNNMSLNDYSKK